MELGQLLKQARLEMGLSQRQLCGEEITRNMLSQIEHGTARPSMDTLQYLAGRLHRPVSYFLQEEAPSLNQSRICRARQAYREKRCRDALEILAGFQEPDEIFEGERWLLETLCRLALAEAAVDSGRIPYGAALLKEAARTEEKSPYCREALKRQRLMLQARIHPRQSREILEQLPPDGELFLRAQAAFQDGFPEKCAAALDLAPRPSDSRWSMLRGDAAFAMQEFEKAAECYRMTEKLALPQLEKCYEALGDYKMAYYYAKKQRENSR